MGNFPYHYTRIEKSHKGMAFSPIKHNIFDYLLLKNQKSRFDRQINGTNALIFIAKKLEILKIQNRDSAQSLCCLQEPTKQSATQAR